MKRDDLAIIRSLAESIRKGELKSVYLLSGDESFFVNECQKYLVNEIRNVKNNAVDVTTFDREEASPQNIIRTLTTPSLFQSFQLVLARDTEWLGSKRKVDLAEIQKWMQSESTSATLIITALSVDKRLSFTKAVSRYGLHLEFPKTPCYGQYDPSGDPYYPVVRDRLSKANQTIQADAWKLLRQLVPDDLWAVVNAGDTVSAYAGTSIRIEKQDVVKCVSDHSDLPGYLVIQALGDKDAVRLKKTIEKTLLDGTHPLVLSKILSNRIRSLMTACSMNLHRFNLPMKYVVFKNQMLPKLMETVQAHPVANSILGTMNPYAFHQLLIQMKQFSLSDLVECLERLAIIDRQLKSGSADPEKLFEMALLPLCIKGRLHS